MGSEQAAEFVLPEYDAAMIQVLSWHAGVRIRPGMYLGGVDGVAMARAVAIAVAAVARQSESCDVRIAVRVRDGARVSLRALGLDEDEMQVLLEDCVRAGRGGGVFDSHETWELDPRAASGIVNALSTSFELCARTHEPRTRAFERARPVARELVPPESGVSMEFALDETIFTSGATIDGGALERMLQVVAIARAGVAIELVDERRASRRVFHEPEGLAGPIRRVASPGLVFGFERTFDWQAVRVVFGWRAAAGMECVEDMSGYAFVEPPCVEGALVEGAARALSRMARVYSPRALERAMRGFVWASWCSEPGRAAHYEGLDELIAQATRDVLCEALDEDPSLLERIVWAGA